LIEEKQANTKRGNYNARQGKTMNKIYRLVTSRVSGIVRVAPETARAQGKGKRLSMTAPLAAALACAAPAAWGGIPYWSALTGDWFAPGNWSTNAVPSAADQVTINNGGTAQVQSAAAAAWATYVGTTGSGTLSISGGGVLSDTHGYIGRNAGGSGAVTVDGAGSSWSNSSHLYVGEYGSGTLSISNGGALSSMQSLIGYRAGSSGAVTVDGAGSSWSKSGGSLYLGFYGSGTLAISNGGAVSSLTSYIGFEAGGSGAVTVDGADSSWSNSGDLYVGVHGSGTLSISHGGAVSNTHGFIGGPVGGSSTVTVDGAGSNWSNSGDLYVGDYGSGTLSISHGGAVSDRNGLIGYSADSSGAVAVDGAGSSWSNSDALHVGYFGSGTLDIRNGGAVSNTYGYLRRGAVTVDGADSRWSNSGALYLGLSGSGTLVIRNGGTVSNTTGYIGLYGGSGAVTVDGAGSRWSNSGNLYVGESDSGTLSISNGGAVNVAGGAGTLTLARYSGSSGTLNIGAGGAAGMLNAAAVYGGAGTATLNFNHSDSAYHFTRDGSASGTAISIGGRVSVNHVGSGTTLLTGNSSYSGNTTVDRGTLAIRSGGAVSDTEGYIGRNAGGSGAVAVDGAGSRWSNSGSLYVGDSGNGTLAIGNGGAVSNANGHIGHVAGGSGAVTVDGAGSRWSNSGAVIVGQSGSGTLAIRNGGAVSNANGHIGLYLGGSGAVTVDGAGSSWSSSGVLTLGYYGNGTLSISNGGAANVAGGTGTTVLANYSGSSGTLDIGAGGAAGVLNAATVYGGAGTATLNFNHSDSAYHFTRDGSASGTAIAIHGSTSVNHVGSGATVLAGVNTYSGDTNIDNGTLIVNGRIAGATFVNAGGTLGGSGTLGHVTVASGGTLSPGNSPGILSVNGDLTLNAGATTVMQIDGMTQGAEYDQIDVSGSATLAGTLDLRFSFVPTGGSRFNLIEAGSLVLAGDPQTGFNSITDNLSSNLGAALRVMPLVDAGSFDILIQQLSFIEASGGNLAPNQRSVAANLDSFSTSGRGAALFGELNLLSAGELPGAFDSLSGAQHAHTRPLIAQASRQFMRVLGDRLNWEAPASNTAANRFGNITLAYNGGDIASLFGAPVSGKPASNLWLRAMGGFGDIDGDGNAAGADYNSSGMALGYDREVRDGLRAGVAFGFTRSDVDAAAGNTGIDSYQLAAYGRRQWADDYLAASLGIGHHRADSTRRIRFGGFSEVARADYATDGLGLALEAGRHYAWSAASRVTPFAGLEYGHFRQHGYQESGAGDANLRFVADGMDSLRSLLGARLSNALAAADGTRLDTAVGLSWAHEFMDRTASLNPAFAVNGSVPFKISGPASGRDHLLATLGASARLGKAARLELDYSGEFAEAERQHAVSATFRMQW